MRRIELCCENPRTNCPAVQFLVAHDNSIKPLERPVRLETAIRRNGALNGQKLADHSVEFVRQTAHAGVFFLPAVDCKKR